MKHFTKAGSWRTPQGFVQNGERFVDEMNLSDKTFVSRVYIAWCVIVLIGGAAYFVFR